LWVVRFWSALALGSMIAGGAGWMPVCWMLRWSWRGSGVGCLRLPVGCGRSMIAIVMIEAPRRFRTGPPLRWGCPEGM
jgi:hypothetical protein